MATSKRYSAEWALAGRFPCVTYDSGGSGCVPCHQRTCQIWSGGIAASSIPLADHLFYFFSFFFSLWVRIWKLCVLGKGRKMTRHNSLVPQWSFLDVCFHVVVGVQSPSCVWFFATPWTVGRQASLSLTISQSLFKFTCSLFSYIFTIQEWIKNIRLV